MVQSMSFGAQTGMLLHTPFAGPVLDDSVLDAMVDILTQPRIKQCTHCSGKGLVAPRAVCACFQGHGRTA